MALICRTKGGLRYRVQGKGSKRTIERLSPDNKPPEKYEVIGYFAPEAVKGLARELRQRRDSGDRRNLRVQVQSILLNDIMGYYPEQTATETNAHYLFLHRRTDGRLEIGRTHEITEIETPE